MIVLSPIEEIELVDVYDRGVANQERILLRVKRTVEIAQFGIFVGLVNPMVAMTATQPLADHFFWFGDGVANTGEFIFVYTGPGTPRKTTLNARSDVAYVLHWGRASTLFASSLFVPVVVRLGGIIIGKPPQNTLQRALPNSNEGNST